MTPTKLLVALQFGSLAGLAWLGGFPSNIGPIILFDLGLLIGVWAVISKRFSVSVMPTPTTDMPLITHGPYRFIRHPMYLSVLLIGLSWCLDGKSEGFIAWLLFLLLIWVIYTKINIEEKLLAQTFGDDYKKYKKATKKLFPSIY